VCGGSCHGLHTGIEFASARGELGDRLREFLIAGGQGHADDLSEQEQQLVWATQGVPDVDLFNQKLDGTAWRTKPSWYIVANNDRTVQPDLERFVAKRMGAHTYDLDSSHVAMLSHPDFVLDVIRTAAKSV
jgi:pimeloyl-ACP methyl ester carboxylesterase